MFEGYKVVANTAVGRRRYLKYLLPQVLVSDVVDRYDLWVNTLDKTDIAFFEAMAREFPKLNLIWQPKGEIDGIYSMADFYPMCQDEDTIYIKLDDDVVWFDPDFFTEICRYRIEHPEYFLVSPLVINNGICNYILQNRGIVEFNQYLSCQGYDPAFYNGYLAEQLHNWFIDTQLNNGDFHRILSDQPQEIAMQRFAINAVAWFGSEFKKFGGVLSGDDEEFLTVIYPVRNNLTNSFDCKTVVSHFSFSAQRAYLDQTDILSKYEAVLHQQSSAALKEILETTDRILKEVEQNKESILAEPLPRNYHKAVLHPVSPHEKIYRIADRLLGMIRVPKAHQRLIGHTIINVIRGNRDYIKK